MKVFRTEYDHHIITKSPKGKITHYEGYSLCPTSIQKKIDKGDFTEVKDCFGWEAISFGYGGI